MPTMTEDQLHRLIQEWLRWDKDPITHQEITKLVESNDLAELYSRFSTRIAFGTAGLRARMQAGPSSMNNLVILQATQGLARYAKYRIPNPIDRGVVIGYDNRAFNGMSSQHFAKLAAGIFRKEGFKVFAFEGLVHTPMVPFATKKLQAALGLMITASHNPAADNGYKVYWQNAVQIIPPHDSCIAAMIDSSLEVTVDDFDPPLDENPWKETESLKTEYIEMVKKLATVPQRNANSPIPSFVYTAMHGVGYPFARAAFSACGFPAEKLGIVAEQIQPDPKFPTVKFPNPEEKGALNLAMAHADKIDAPIVLANDPDADRFCAAEKIPSGEWKIFTGDQIGILLGCWTLEKYKETGKPVNKLAVCASTVSSKMLAAVAEKENFTFRETLTGFKYLGNECINLEREGFDAIFAYEEAIGYLNGTQVKDKDGISALICFCEMASELYHRGKTVSDWLEELFDSYGFFTTSNSYFISRDSNKTNEIFTKLRFGEGKIPAVDAQISSLSLPKTIAGYPIDYIRDLTIGYDSSKPPSFKPLLPVDPSSHMISFSTGNRNRGDGVQVTGTIRTSGTEPKIKFYLEASGKVRERVREKLSLVREAVGVEWLRWKEFKLEPAQA